MNNKYKKNFIEQNLLYFFTIKCHINIYKILFEIKFNLINYFITLK